MRSPHRGRRAPSLAWRVGTRGIERASKAILKPLGVSTAVRCDVRMSTPWPSRRSTDQVRLDWWTMVVFMPPLSAGRPGSASKARVPFVHDRAGTATPRNSALRVATGRKARKV